MLRKIAIPIAVLMSLLSLACWGHKEQFHTTVINQTGSTLHSIEVDYPGGTYGIADLAAGASNQKWIFANGPCHYSLRFVDERGKQYSPKPIDVSRAPCPPGVTLTIDQAMNVSAVATPQ
jgi:hypothetical protein